MCVQRSSRASRPGRRGGLAPAPEPLPVSGWEVRTAQQEERTRLEMRWEAGWDWRDTGSLQYRGILWLWHPLITKTNTHWLCTGSPVHPLLSKLAAKPPSHSLLTALLTGMLAGSPSLPTLPDRAGPWECQAGQSKVI